MGAQGFTEQEFSIIEHANPLGRVVNEPDIF